MDSKWFNIHDSIDLDIYFIISMQFVILSSKLSFILPGSRKMSFTIQKKEITRKHRQECLSVFELIYGEGPTLDGDLIIINFFSLVTY